MGGSSPVYRIAKLQWFLLVRNRGMAPRVISRFIYTIHYRIYIFIQLEYWVLYKNALYKNLSGSVPQTFGFLTNSLAVWFVHIKPKDISSVIHHNSNLAYSSYVYQCFALYPTARPGFPSATCLRQFGAQAPTCTEHPTGPEPKIVYPYTQWFCWSLSLLNGYNWEYTSFSDIPMWFHVVP